MAMQINAKPVTAIGFSGTRLDAGFQRVPLAKVAQICLFFAGRIAPPAGQAGANTPPHPPAQAVRSSRCGLTSTWPVTQRHCPRRFEAARQDAVPHLRSGMV